MMVKAEYSRYSPLPVLKFPDMNKFCFPAFRFFSIFYRIKPMITHLHSPVIVEGMNLHASFYKLPSQPCFSFATKIVFELIDQGSPGSCHTTFIMIKLNIVCEEGFILCRITGINIGKNNA